MNKIAAVIKREYITRVRKKSFIIMTILMPLALILLMTLPMLMTQVSVGVTNVLVLDESDLFERQLRGNRNVVITHTNKDLATVKDTFQEEFDAFLHIPNFDPRFPGGVTLYSHRQIGLGTISFISDQLIRIIEPHFDIDRNRIEWLRSSMRIDNLLITEEGTQAGNQGASIALGFGMGFFMYFMIFFYGSMVMNSAFEEKKNRIIEILASSIKPFQLMLGKVIGIAMIALTQLAIWAVLGVIIFAFFTVGVIPNMQRTSFETEIPAEIQTNMTIRMIESLTGENTLNTGAIVFGLIFFFLFGYLFYSTLFSAVGSLTDDDPNQAQHFMIPLTIPIILSIFIMMNVIENPHSSLAVWASIIPFSSPLIMLARIPFNPPAWQLAVSCIVLVLSFFGSTWVSGKIFRTAILMYGKNLKWKDVLRFLRV